jgi:3-keto-5-aminohexanoate cleavage enzyme
VTDHIDWDRVRRTSEREGDRMIWKPYGLPEITNPYESAFAPGIEVLPAWDIPETAIVSAALTGAFYSRKANPNQPLTTDELLAQARECLDAGASTVHVHVRDDHGYNTLDPERFRQVIEPLRSSHPDAVVDGCLVCALEGEWERMKDVLDSELLDAVPVNTASVYCGDSLFSKPVHVVLEKARLVQEQGTKVQIAVYSDADVDNARRYLINPGLIEGPPLWVILPALPGCSPMHNPRQMMEGLTRIVHSIQDCAPDSVIMVCAAGRASTYLTAQALLMGLHVRVGMEDTVWLWPHRNDLITSNVEHVRMAVQLVELLGRRVATPAEYRQLVGMGEPAASAADATPAGA